MSLLTYCMNILMSLMMLSMVFVMITMSLASARRITEVLNEKSDLDNPENPDFDIPDGSITFDHVYFNYKKGAGEPVLSDINLSIKSGETIGIIGGTGSATVSYTHLDVYKRQGSDFVFVTHYPSAKRPFYAMDSRENPAETESFDLLFRGLEVTTGGQRIHNYREQVEKIESRCMHVEAFESYLMTVSYTHL